MSANKLFLATGVGHSGTTWFSSFMSEIGYPCSHEEVFSLRNHGPLTSSDSSWLAVPYLHTIPDDVPVVHLVRDPLRVLNSYLRTNNMVNPPEDTPEGFQKFAYRHLPERSRYSRQEDRVAAHVAWWDEPVAKRDGTFLLRVGNPGDSFADNWNAEKLAEMVRYCTGDERDPDELRATAVRLGRVNDHARRRPNRLSWDILSNRGPMKHLRQKAVRYGFLEE